MRKMLKWKFQKQKGKMIKNISINDLPLFIIIESFLQKLKEEDKIIDYSFEKNSIKIFKLLPAKVHQIQVEGVIEI